MVIAVGVRDIENGHGLLIVGDAGFQVLHTDEGPGGVGKVVQGECAFLSVLLVDHVILLLGIVLPSEGYAAVHELLVGVSCQRSSRCEFGEIHERDRDE